MGQVGIVGRSSPGRATRLSTAGPTVAGWALGVAVTSALVGTPYLLFAYHSPDLHLVLDSLDTGVALLVAYLLWGRYRRRGRMQDLLLADGLLLLGLAGVGMTVSLHLLGFDDGRTDVWLPVTVRVGGAVFVLAASLTGGRLVSIRALGAAKVVPWAALVLVAGVIWAVHDVLPVALAQSPPASAQRPVITGHPALLVGHALTAGCFAVASILFAIRAEPRGGAPDELLRWLGPAFALAAFARLNYVLYPSLYSDWLYTGDLLRTGCYVVLLVGAAREISRYWSAQAGAAVLDDRRRLARELHDGVVQELTYIRLEAADATSRPEVREHILDACDRALDEARAAVDALGRSSDEPLGFALHRAARQVAERYHATLEVELDDSVHADHDQRHALVRITREAVSNAIRHGRAGRVQVRLTHDEGARRLRVHDDGEGFDPALARRQATGYGLTSMEERARGLTGSFSIESAPGKGTTVEVSW